MCAPDSLSPPRTILASISSHHLSVCPSRVTRSPSECWRHNQPANALGDLAGGFPPAPRAFPLCFSLLPPRFCGRVTWLPIGTAYPSSLWSHPSRRRLGLHDSVAARLLPKFFECRYSQPDPLLESFCACAIFPLVTTESRSPSREMHFDPMLSTRLASAFYNR